MSMFQILNFLTDNAIDLLNNTFALVGRTYGFMLDISTSSSTKNLNDYILGLTQSFYTIAGIFMLFRLSISVFGYILDPDKMTDSKAGGGKLLTNVVFTLLLLIGFYPNGLIFNTLQNIEDVFLSQAGTGTEEREDGFISNIFNKIGVQTKKKESGFNDNKENSVNNLLLENVNAANKKTCYYSEENNKVDEIVFTTDSEGRITGLATNLVNNRRTVDNSAKGKKDCNSLAMVYKPTDFYYYHIVDKSTVPEDKSKWASDIEWIHQVCEKKENCTGGRNKKFFSHNLNSAEATFANGVAGAFYSCNMNDSDAKEKYQKAFNKAKSDSSELSEFFEGLEYKGKEDAKSKELCNAFEEHPLYIPEAGKKGKDLIEDGSLDAYFFAGIVFSLIITAYLIILCVEVIVRNLKLTLFQIIAPIPIINGIDPNDKMRSQWFKSYFGAYLDLFFKIFAIQLLARIIPAISDIMEGINALGKLFFLIALLTFAKMVPNLISKILGIENLGGSLKTSGGMLKKGLGIGAGMAIGGALGGIVGGYTSEGKAASLKNTFKGIASGARMGAKGSIGKIPTNVSSATAKENRQRADGLNWWQRKKSNVMETVGYDPQTKFDNLIQDIVDEKSMLDKFRKNKDNIESMAESSNYMSDLNSRLVTGKISKEDFKAEKERIIKAAESAHKKQYLGNDGKYYDMLNDDGGRYGDWWREVKDSNGNMKLQVIGDDGQYTDYTQNGQVLSSFDDYKGSFMEKDEATGVWKKMAAHESLGGGNIKYEGAATGKIMQAEREMNAEIVDNTDLRKMLGLTEAGAREIDTFAEFKEYEGKAKDMSNERQTKIIRMQSSDEYRRASGMGSSSK